MNNEVFKLFVYGSLRSGFRNPVYEGELYTINNPQEFSWAIGQLDDYEGLNVEEGETPLYKREEVIAYRKGEPYTAWIYWYNLDITGKPEIESGDVLEYLQKKNKP